MSQTQRPRVTHKAILQETLKQLLTLARKFEKKIIEFPDHPCLVPTKNPGIAVIRLAPQTLLKPVTNEIAAEMALRGTWIQRTPRKLIRTGVNRSTPGDICNAIGIFETSSPDLIGIIGIDPPCGLNHS